MLWLPGTERVHATTDGGSFYAAPPRLVLHTTEGDTAEGAIATYRRTSYWPHFTIDCRRRRAIQHIPLDRAGRALANDAGGVETNRLHAIQIELVGRADETPLWPDADVVWLGELLAPMMAALKIPLTAPTFHDADGGYGEGARSRMSGSAWQRFSGVCGHQHVPENSHWDPGRFRIGLLLDAMKGDVMNERQEKILQQVANRMENAGPTIQQIARKLDQMAGRLDALEAGRVDVDKLAAQLRGELGPAIAAELSKRLES